MLERIRAILVVVVTLSIIACGDEPEPVGADDVPVADHILRSGRIVTMNGASDIVAAVAIADGKILAVGENEQIDGFAGSETQVIDLDGKVVTPGMVDSHIHALGYGLHISQHVMFSTGEPLTVQDMLDGIEDRAQQVADGQWIYVRGPYSLDFVDEGRLPNRTELDLVAPNNPVFINMQGHVGVVNSAAIALSGVTKDTPNPKNGFYMHDPNTGELNGTMYEFPAFTPFLRHLPPYGFDVRVNAARAANEVFTRLGITTVVNLWAEPENLKVLQHLESLDELTVRWSMVYRLAPEVFKDKSHADIEGILQDFGLPDESSSDWVKVNGVKIIYDGFAEAAYMHDEYLEDRFGEGFKGVAFWNKDSMQAVMEVCAANDIQVFVHVAGDQALDDVLDTMDAVNEQYPLAGRRWTLEHASTEPTAENLQQVKEFELFVSTQQAMGWSIGKTFKETWGEERGATFAPNRSWLDALGHPYVKAGSDNRPINPFIGFWSFIVREDVDGRVGRPDQVLAREDVLRMYTANGTYGIFAENDWGKIEAGQFADLLVLSDDIFEVPAEQIRSIQPLMTMVNGKFVYVQ
tara:strand:- start:1831 stop:3564 length:1734 start_codon:yes stop_codon:yes gene_type:complete